jgi:hypothetical protein
MDGRHVVTAPLVVVKDETGADLYLHRGDVVPDATLGTLLERLLSQGLITRKRAPRAPAARPSSDDNNPK